MSCGIRYRSKVRCVGNEIVSANSSVFCPTKATWFVFPSRSIGYLSLTLVVHIDMSLNRSRIKRILLNAFYAHVFSDVHCTDKDKNQSCSGARFQFWRTSPLRLFSRRRIFLADVFGAREDSYIVRRCKGMVTVA
jgi:hypothetical protein